MAKLNTITEKKRKLENRGYFWSIIQTFLFIFFVSFTDLTFLFFSVGNNISSPIVLEHFVVMDDYKKQAKSDINLKKGKFVDVIEKRDCGKSFIFSSTLVGLCYFNTMLN